MPGRGVALLALLTILCGLAPANAWAHAALVLSDPAAGAALGDTPTAVRLTFSENPAASLSTIRVLDSSGTAHELGRPEPVSGSPLSLVVRVERLPKGVYTVSWRVVSAVDGHATSGAYAFGVGVAPTGAAASAGTTSPGASGLEMVARWLFLAGLVVLLGAAFAGVARFGAAEPLGAGGWLLSAAGLVLLALAQRRTADASFRELLHTPVGRALVWRAVAVGAAGAALLVARRGARRFRRAALAAAVLAVLAAIGVHVAAGHAAAGSWPHVLSVGLQWAHVAAAAVWIGGLAALLYSVRGAPSPAKTRAVRRFSTVAAGGLVVVGATGLTRAVEELSSVGDLVSTGYGEAVLAKIALLLAIAGLGARNRWWSVPAADTNLGLLRRTSSAELALAAGALAAAAVLGSLAPPASARALPPLGLTVSGADARGTVHVELTAASADPGPNRFVLRAVDNRSHAPVQGRVTLRFTPLDDPGVASTSLALSPRPDYGYGGSGANMVFDGRWGVTVLIQPYGPGRTIRVPLELDAQGPAEFVSVERIPGQAPKYTLQVGNLGYVRISPHPEHAGRSTIYVTCYDVFSDVVAVDRLVLTAAAGDGPTAQHRARPVGGNVFAAGVDLARGTNTITVVAKTSFGTRLRAVLQLDVPG